MYLCSMEMHLFKNIELNNIPERMNNPFSYEPHPLCIEACRELQDELSQRNDWREEIDRGKMFGVLIVEAGNGKIGYLRAYSGQIGGRSDWEGFVPAVFDYLQPDGYFKVHEAEISEMNQQIRQLEANENLKKAKSLIDDLQQKRQEVIANYQTKIKEAKEKRDARRQEALSAGTPLSEEEEKAMIKESQFMKAELRRLKKSLSEKTSLETEYEAYQADILSLKQLRKTLSDALQQWLFSQFHMQNHEGESKDLLEIFRDAALRDYPQATIATRCRLPEVANAANRNCCNMLTSMVTSLCKWPCSGGAKVRRKRFAITCSSIQPAMANASRYCIGCCPIQSFILKLPKSIFWKSYTKTTSWQLSASHRDCCLCQAKIHPSHPSIPSCGRNIRRQAVR